MINIDPSSLILFFFIAFCPTLQRRVSLYPLQPDRQGEKGKTLPFITHFPLIWHYIQVKIGTAGRTPAKRFDW
jgi:hypothetical protein